MPAMLGKVIAGRYKITEESGSDSLTALYKAQDTTENKPVFITLLKEKAKQRPLETLLRFKREQEQISKLNHPNLLKIYSQGEFEGQDYVAKEYFDSLLLSQFLDQPQYINQPLLIDTAVDIILQISSALDIAHQAGILHQALTPQSILITQDLGTIKLASFGYNLLTDISRITEKEEIISTFGYLSPESSGILRRPIDVRSDIYSLGVIFYRLVTGRLPYTASDISTLIHEHIAQIPGSPSNLNNKIPPVIENIVLRLIAKDPQDRYQSLTGLIFDLMEYQNQRSRGKELVDFEIARFDKLRQISFNTRLIGRDKELKQLTVLLDQTKHGKGSLAFVFGEPGIGKSRLVDELRAQVHSFNGIFVGGKCYQYEFRTPYKVFSEAIDAYVDKIKRLTQADKDMHIERIKNTLGELGGEVVKISPTITDLIGQPPKLVELEPEKEKIRFLITVTNFLSALSTPDSPLLMFLDDLQWVDDGSLEILARVAEKLPNTSTVLIVSYRDNEVDQDHPLAQLIRKLTEQNISFLNIPVKSFSLSETAAMICQILLEKEERSLPLANELQERAKGNPFFTLELLHFLVDSNVVYLKEEHYVYELEKLKTTDLPTTIVDAVLKRMKDLSEENQQIISYASIMSKEIDFGLLAELSQKPSDKILNSIEDGIKSQLLFRDLTGRENIFFMHDRIREAFYKRVPEEERIPLHKHIAEVLEERNKDNLESAIYDLAYHFTQGGVEDKALQYSIPAAHKAKTSYANTLAISLYNAAKEILERQNKTKTNEYRSILENLGEAYRLTGEFNESVRVFEICESLIPRENRVARAKILARVGETLFDKGEWEECIRLQEEAVGLLGVKLPKNALRLYIGIGLETVIQMFHTLLPGLFISKRFKASEQDLILPRILLRLGMIYYFINIYMSFYVYIKGLNISERLGPTLELSYIYSCGGPVWLTFPWFTRAYRDLNRGLKIAQDLGDKIKEGCSYTFFSSFYYMFNDPRKSVEYGQKCISLLKGLGEYWILGVSGAFRNQSSWLLGRFKDNLPEAEEFLSIAREVNALQPICWALMERANWHSFVGDLDEAVIQDLKESYRLAKETKDSQHEIYALSFLAFAYLRRRQYREAIETTEEVAKLFPTHHNKGNWILSLFPIGAQTYLDTIINNPSLSTDQKRKYLKRAKWWCQRSTFWSFIFKYFYGWSLQVNGTYYWLSGNKKKALLTWDKGLKFLRTNKNNPGGDKYRIAYILLEEAKFLLSDKMGSDPIIRKKAYSNLIEARDLFTEMGCKLDLETTTKLLESISPEGISVDSRTVLTQKRHLDSLLSVTQAIGSIFILDELLQKILEYGLKVTGAERGFLLLYDSSKNLSLKVSSGLEKDLSGTSFSYDNYRISLELINEVANTKSASIADQQTASNTKIQNELKTFSVRQAIAVPLQTRDKPIGILYLDNRLAGGTFGKDELELMKGFAVQASVSIENAFLVSSLVEQERLKQELELGRQIQESLLPKESPNLPNLKLIGTMLPAKEIGGDYYDFITPDSSATTGGAHAGIPNAQSSCDISSVGIVIGDVSGKGVAAGLLMAMAKTAIHTLSQEETSPKQILLRTNQILVKHIGAQKFMTMLYFRYDTSTKTLTYSSAGHEHILIYRSNLQSPRVVPEGASPLGQPNVEAIISGGFMLGMIPDISSFLEDKTITLQPGDKIILYTDGVTEARNPSEDLFGLEKLIELIQKYGSKPAEQLLNSIKEEVYSYIGTREQYDDITLVVMEAT